jgi:hypothetical protein
MVDVTITPVIASTVTTESTTVTTTGTMMPAGEAEEAVARTTDIPAMPRMTDTTTPTVHMPVEEIETETEIGRETEITTATRETEMDIASATTTDTTAEHLLQLPLIQCKPTPALSLPLSVASQDF